MKNSNLLNLMVAILFCMAATNAKAQLEVKLDPVDLIFNSPKLSAEYIVNDKVGLELIMGFKYGKSSIDGFNTDYTHQGYSLRVVGKYYFNPKNGADRWYAGIYGGSKRTILYNVQESETVYNYSNLSVGGTIGYKWVLKSGLLIEPAIGIGKAFDDEFSWILDDIDGFFRISLGYRF